MALIIIPIITISIAVLRRLSLDTLPKYMPNMTNAIKQAPKVVAKAETLSAISKKGNTGTNDPMKLENPWVNILM